MKFQNLNLARRVYYGAVAVAALCFGHAADSQTIEPEQHCATLPTYKYFEDIQYDAYTKTNPLYYKLLEAARDQRSIINTFKDVGKELSKRQDKLHGLVTNDDDKDTSESVDVIQQWAKEFPLPTCYENPLVYYLIMNYKKQIDRAQLALSYNNTDEIYLATLPTVDINAHTYPASAGLGNILAFNVQLFMFDYQITKTLISTINLRDASTKIAIGVNSDSAINALKPDPNILVDFSVALMEFLGITDPSTRPIDKSYDPLLIKFTEGMELFAVAHEYGHVLKKHASPIVSLPLGLNVNGQPIGGETVLAYARSWKQELEADQIGISLVIQALNSSATDNEGRLSWLYSAKGALFFFRCLDIVDQAKYVLEHRKTADLPTLAERVFLRAFADGKTTPQENDAHKEMTIGGYPPAWLRLERVEEAIESKIAAQPPNSDAFDFSRIADALIENAPIVWRAVAPRFPVAVDLVKLEKDGRLTQGELKGAKIQTDATPISYETDQFLPGCYVRVNLWISSFLCNPELQNAIVAFEDDKDDDSVIAAYRGAVLRDQLLLSGAQATWARTTLTGASNEWGRHAVSILALTGDTTNLGILHALDTGSWSDEDRLNLARAEQFLSLHGRNVSLSRLATLAPQAFTIGQFLNFPGDSSQPIRSIPKSLSSTTLRSFFAEYGSVEGQGSLSGLVLALAYENLGEGEIYGDLADLLHANSLNDAALQYAEYGLSVGGNLALLENIVGNILTSRHDYVNANNHYGASLAAGRNDGWPEMNMASNLDKLGSLDEAEEMYRKALLRKDSVRNSEEYAEYLNNTAWFLVTKRSSDHSKLEEAFRFSAQANALTGMKDPNFLDTLAECQFELGDKTGAIEMWKAALAFIPAKDLEQREAIERKLKIHESDGKR